MKKYNRLLCALLVPFIAGFLSSCDDDEESTPDPVAGFTFAVDTENTLKITFTNTSTDALSYSWNFGDGNSSTDESPEHTYAATGDYEVTLTATGENGNTNESTKTVQAIEPVVPVGCADNANLNLLTGCVEGGKAWRFRRVDGWKAVGPGTLGEDEKVLGEPSDPMDISWWAAGESDFDGDECQIDDEYVFHPNGVYENNNNGTYLFHWDVANFELGQENPQFSDPCLTDLEPDKPTWEFLTKTGSDGNDYLFIVFSEGSSIGMYQSIEEYQIMELTEDLLTVRLVDVAPGDLTNDDGWRYYQFEKVD